MTREDALQMLRELEPTKSERIAKLEETGFPGEFSTFRLLIPYTCGEVVQLSCQEKTFKQAL